MKLLFIIVICGGLIVIAFFQGVSYQVKSSSMNEVAIIYRYEAINVQVAGQLLEQLDKGQYDCVKFRLESTNLDMGSILLLGFKADEKQFEMIKQYISEEEANEIRDDIDKALKVIDSYYEKHEKTEISNSKLCYE